MQFSLRSTWIAVLVAALAVSLTGAFIVRNFVRDVFVECRGTLEVVPRAELGSSPDLEQVDLVKADLTIQYDEVSSKKAWEPTKYKNVRVVWTRTDSECACGDAAVRWGEGGPWNAVVSRDRETGLYVVRPSSLYDVDDAVAVFRKIDDSGRRFQASRVLSPKHVPMLVFLLSLGALGVAGLRTVRARPYVTRMHGWRAATLRPDGLVESETGATLGTIESRVRVRAGAVIVDPAAFEGRDIYREVPILLRRQIAPGSHAQWLEGTMRRLRDARSLSVISVVTTALALGGHFIAG